MYRPHLTFIRFNEDDDLVFQRKENYIFIPTLMVIEPKGGFIVDHIYFIKEMKIVCLPTDKAWYHVPGTNWETLDDNLLLGHLETKCFYVTKIRMVKYD